MQTRPIVAGLTPSAFDVSSKRPHTRTVLPHPQRRFQGLTSKVNATHDFFRRTPHGPTPNASLAGLSLDSNVPIPLTLASNPRLDQPATLGMLPRRKGSPLTFSQSCPSFVHPPGQPSGFLGPIESRNAGAIPPRRSKHRPVASRGCLFAPTNPHPIAALDLLHIQTAPKTHGAANATPSLCDLVLQ